MKKLFSSLVVISTLGLSGCATIVGSGTQTIPLVTNPDGVHYKVKDERGVTVAQGTTPGSVTLSKHDGSYFGKKSYVVTFEKEGYQPATAALTANANGKYILGNFFFGGLVGWLLLDPLNGGMYDLSPEKILVEMDK